MRLYQLDGADYYRFSIYLASMSVSKYSDSTNLSCSMKVFLTFQEAKKSWKKITEIKVHNNNNQV